MNKYLAQTTTKTFTGAQIAQYVAEQYTNLAGQSIVAAVAAVGLDVVCSVSKNEFLKKIISGLTKFATYYAIYSVVGDAIKIYEFSDLIDQMTDNDTLVVTTQIWETDSAKGDLIDLESKVFYSVLN
jgi:hypothetical protein